MVDWSSTDFANNIDDVFDRTVLGAAFVTYAANSIIDHFLAIFVSSEVVTFVAWVTIFFLSTLVFAYWSKIMG
ncbi:hypothetical protein [Halospeciosus flavus]|uniref:Uncharacterized protein n=1 Tax=Halospeciosus flavus TaxID=3032283 RepID=A0ABD5Z8V3_9EURY|nr:hypothetical protein [Halospeciosus flavus]